MMQNRSLWDSQSGAIRFLISEVPYEQQVGVFGPTGWGKSTIARIGLEILTRDEFKVAVLAVPQLQIEAAFAAANQTWTFPTSDLPEDTIHPPVDVSLYPLIALRDSDLNGQVGMKTRLTFPDKNNPITLTTQQALTCWGTDILPRDLSRCLLAVDEAHRVSKSNKLGQFVSEWLRRGGHVLYLTATPYRATGVLGIPPDVPCYHWTLAEHTISGHAPEHVRLKFTKSKTIKAKTLDDLRGKTLPPSKVRQLRAICREVAEVWESNGQKKAVIIIPAGESERFSEHLCAVLQKSKSKPRVFDAVGKDPQKKMNLAELLDAERTVENYVDSQVDIIVACARFDEGTDWPFCAHVINVGLPRSMPRIVQRLGRALRNKEFIKGYPKGDEALMTFLVPSASTSLWAEFDQHAKDHAFIVGCLMADTRTGTAYLSDLRNRLTDVGRKRGGNPQLAAANADRLASLIGLDVERTRGAYAKCQQAVQILRRQNTEISWERIENLMRHRMKLDATQIAQCRLAYSLRHKVLEDEQLIKLLNSWAASASRAMNTKQESNRIIRLEMQEAFDEIVDEFEGLLEASDSVLDIVAEFTGQTAQQVATALSERLGDVVVSLDDIDTASQLYWAEHDGQEITLPEGDEDASPYFALPPGTLTWRQVMNQIRRYTHGDARASG